MIRRIELHNFATHPDTTIEFGNGKNIVIGQTGSGKTNLLQAIDFAFLGDVQGATLPELIADGAESAEIFLDYMDSRTNQSYRIHRTLTRDADGKVDHVCTVTNLETNEQVKKPDPVRKTLEALGVEQSVFTYVVHVPQGRFADILQETQDRKAVLDRLFRISQLENAYHDLGVREGPITQIENRKQDKLLEKAKLEEKASLLGQDQGLLQKLTQEWETKQQKLDETRKERDQLTAIASSIGQNLAKIDSLDTKLKEAKAMSETCQMQIGKLLPQLHGLLSSDEYTRIEPLDSQATRDHKSKLELELSTLSAERDRLETEHTDSIKKTATTKSLHDNSVKDKTSLQKQLEDINKYLEGKGERPNIECDKCGSVLTPHQWTKHIDETSKKLSQKDIEIKQLNEQWSSATLSSEELHRKLEDAKATVDNLSKAIGILDQLAAQREEIEKAATSTKQLLEEEKHTIVELRTMLSIDLIQSDDQVVEKARSTHSQLESMPQQIQQLELELKSYDANVLEPQQKRVDEARDAAAKVKDLDPQISADTKKIEMLQTIRNAFREIQPAVRRNFVSRITASANDYLRRLYGGTEIENFEFSEDYEFIVTRAGHKRHAHRLSGGQQVLASMAFLMALSEVLSQLDFLILDEPTTHLDENRRKELVNVLENLRRVPQLIIVDHHPELLEAADTRFQVTLNNEGQSQVVQMSE